MRSVIVLSTSTAAMLAAQNVTRSGSSTLRTSNHSTPYRSVLGTSVLPLGRQWESRTACLGRNNRVPFPTLRVAQIETFGVDEAGSLTWDAHTDPNDSFSAASVLEGYTLRPGQVPAAAPTSTLPTRPDSLQRSSKPVVLVRDTNGW